MPRRLAIVGYGKMGRMVEQLADGFGFDVAARVDIGERPKLEAVDVAIEFTQPEAVISNVEWLAQAGIPIVVGTTGWLSELDRVKAIVAQHGTGLVWGPNFSVGVNIFLRIVGSAAALMKNEPEYAAWGWEMHHAAKKDVPSGTMLKLIEAMRAAGFAGEINVSSTRAGKAPGTHEIGFDSAGDTITLRHTARNREGFAQGALRAAQWIIGRKGVYEFSEVVSSRLENDGPAGLAEKGGQPCSPAAAPR